MSSSVPVSLFFFVSVCVPVSPCFSVRLACACRHGRVSVCVLRVLVGMGVPLIIFALCRCVSRSVVGVVFGVGVSSVIVYFR